MAARLACPLALAALALVAAAPAARAAPPYADLVVADPALAGYWAFNGPDGSLKAQ